MVYVPHQAYMQLAKQEVCNKPVKCTSSTNLRLLSRQAPFSPAIAHYNTGKVLAQTLQITCNAEQKNLYFATKLLYELK